MQQVNTKTETETPRGSILTHDTDSWLAFADSMELMGFTETARAAREVAKASQTLHELRLK